MNHKPYVREISRTGWWLQQPRYIRYMVREATCIFIFIYALLLVYGVKQLAAGPEAWTAYLDLLASPGSILFHLVALAFSLYHTYTWFMLFPQTTPILIGEEFLPGKILIVAQFTIWAILSLIVLVMAGAF